MAFLRASLGFMFMVLFSSATLSIAHPGLPFSWDDVGGSAGGYFGLFPEFYQYSCPQANDIVMSVLEKAIAKEPRMAASLLRLHFHDCFVQGCDASILLDDSSTIASEKRSNPNKNSIRGFEVIDEIKAQLEAACPQTVSCADIVALAARGSTVLSGGPYWELPLGRRDSKTASLSGSNNNIPPPNSTLQNLITLFNRQGLDEVDLVALSGDHTIGVARCVSFRQRLYNQNGNNQPDETLERNYFYNLKSVCPKSGGDNIISPLDFASPVKFDNTYFKLILWGKGLLNSDEVLLTGNGGNTKTMELVKSYAEDEGLFFYHFAKSMVKMGNISPLTGYNGEVRKNCRLAQSASITSTLLNACRLQQYIMAFLRASFGFMFMVLLSSTTISIAHPGFPFTWGNVGGSGGGYFSLFPEFYQFSCPQANDIVMSVLEKAIAKEPRMAASLLRLHFHDCFVQGCDASVLLDDSSKITSEKRSNPNKNSIRGFDVIDEIKAQLEAACPQTVSCADILALAARGSTVLSGGPNWELPLGRRDSKTASLSGSNNNIPPPNSTIQNLITLFNRQGLDEIDLVALSGSHTIGVARCVSFRQRLYNQNGNNQPDETLERGYFYGLKSVCPKSGGDNIISPLDFTSPAKFDNTYFKLIMWGKGLLNSDEVLLTGSGGNTKTTELVKSYAEDEGLFFNQFAKSMVKMGNISPLTGYSGEVRKNCRLVN
ncbi:Plant peroxidase [Macleaya cordata]|uniref:peroxidase n=1 Tax=Macleaya cordata TaxID=56857 RepID=A0A200Q6T7_MACCD|nr:Plant peroxidase [Macleaya cordata]